MLSASIALIALAGCGTVSSDHLTRCPPQKSYSAAFQKRAAAELEALPAGSAVAELVADYGQERKACRAIGGANAS